MTYCNDKEQHDRSTEDLRAEIERLKEAGGAVSKVANDLANERDNLLLQNDELRKALTKIDAMRKRLPDPDFAEQKNTAAGIAEIIEVALKEKRNDEPRRCTCQFVQMSKSVHDRDCAFFP